ncbi:unnamed protein product [Chrysoparadoxa australica]
MGNSPVKAKLTKALRLPGHHKKKEKPPRYPLPSLCFDIDAHAGENISAPDCSEAARLCAAERLKARQRKMWSENATGKGSSCKPQGGDEGMAGQTQPLSALATRSISQATSPVGDSLKHFWGNYRLGPVRGSDTFGCIWDAQDIACGEACMIKAVDLLELSDPCIAAAVQERAIHQRMNHSAIAEVRQVHTGKDWMAMVLEKSEMDLCDRLVEKSFSEKEAAAIVAQLLGALVHMHEMGVVHRNLKPENILLRSRTDDCSVFVSDFGCSSFEGKPSDRDVPCGTAEYAAPEVIQGRPVSSKSDVWSLGVVTYELLCGQLPFRTADDDQLFADIEDANINFGPEWDQRSTLAKEFIEMMLIANQDWRWSAARLLNHPWIALHTNLGGYRSQPPSRLSHAIPFSCCPTEVDGRALKW